MENQICENRTELRGNMPYSVGVFFRKKICTKPSPKNPILAGTGAKEVVTFEQLQKEELKNRYNNKWYKHLQRKILEGAAKRDFEDLMENYNTNLLERREKLLSILENEDKMYIDELKKQLVPSEDQESIALEKVKELRTKKKLFEDMMAEEKIKQKFWADCDDLHQVTTQQHLENIVADRNEQLKEKKALEELQKKEDEYFDYLWQQDYLNKVKDEELKALEKHKKNIETTEILNCQVAAKQAYMQKLQELKQEEANFMVEQQKQFLLEDEWEKEQHRKKQLEIKTALNESIELSKSKMKKLKDEEEQYNKALLNANQAIQIDTDDQQRKCELREEYKRYLNYLSTFKAQKEASERDRDKIISAENDEFTQRLKDLDCLNEQLKKQNLKETLQIRDEQLREKCEQLCKKREEFQHEQEALEKELLLAKKCQMQQKMKKRDCKEAYRKDLKEQIDYQKSKKLEQTKEQLQDIERYKQQEENYQRKVEEMRSNSKFGRIHPMRKAARHLREQLGSDKTITLSNLDSHLKNVNDEFDKNVSVSLCRPDYVDPSLLPLQQYKLKRLLQDKYNKPQWPNFQQNILAYYSGES